MSSQSQSNAPHDAVAVLEYWIGNADEDVEEAKARKSMWFGGSRAVDEEIAERFGNIFESVREGACADWLESADGTLAQIIVLDQFSRNLCRGTPKAFDSDARSLAFSLEMQESGRIEQLGPVGKVFALMPMQHAEDLDIQERSVKAFEKLAVDSATEHRDLLEENAKYARLHRDIVQRFGRFPHRNRILGRQSTQEEIDWLDDGAPTFGQGG